VERTVRDLAEAQCIKTEDVYLSPTPYGKIASYYYITYKTVGLIMSRLSKNYKFKGSEELGERPDGDVRQNIREILF
jgi:superfamily II helicase